MKRLVLVAAFVLAGCSSTKVFHSAIEDITQDTRATVGDFSTYRQLITLNGLMPMHVPGMLFYEPTSRILPDWLAYWLPKGDSPGLLVGISPKRSMIVEARYDAEDPQGAVKTAQQAYHTLRARAVAAVAARMKVGMYEALGQSANEEQTRKLARLLNLAKDKPSAEEITQGKAQAIADAETARRALADAQETFSSLGDNIMVARWTKKEEFQGVAKIADLVGLGTGRQFEESGVLILASIRVLNTSFGEDLFCMARNAQQNPAQFDHLKRISIAVNMIQAKAVGYVSDLDVAHTLALSLDISKEQLGELLKDGLLGAAGDGAKFKAEALVATAMGVSNFGRMVKPYVQQRKTRFHPAARQVEELEEELEGRGEYVTVSVTRVQFTEGMLKDLAASATDTICNEELEPSRSLMETAARTGRRIEISAAAASNLIGHGDQALPQAGALRASLQQKLYTARKIMEDCLARITQLDRSVTDALDAERKASSRERDTTRYSVRISQLARERDSAEIMAMLNDISNDLWKAQNGLRFAAAKQRQGADPADEVAKVAQILGRPESVTLADAAAVGQSRASDPKGEPYRNVSVAGPIQPKTTDALYCRPAGSGGS